MRHRGEGVALGLLLSSLIALFLLLGAMAWALSERPQLLLPRATPARPLPTTAEPAVEAPRALPPVAEPEAARPEHQVVAPEPRVEVAPARGRGAPTVTRQSELRVAGRLSVERADRILTMHDPLALGCYESALRRRPGLTGEAEVLFEVLVGRRAPSVFVMHATFVDEQLERCLVEWLSSVRFPRFSARRRLEVTTTYRFRLE